MRLYYVILAQKRCHATQTTPEPSFTHFRRKSQWVQKVDVEFGVKYAIRVEKVALNDEQTARHTATAQFALCIALRGKNWRPLKSLYNVCRFQYYLVIYFNFSLSGLEYILWTRNLCDTIKLLVQLITKLEGHSARWSACTCDKSQNPKIGQVWRPVAPQTYVVYRKVDQISATPWPLDYNAE